MAYNLTLTNGTAVETLQNGTIDSTTLSINLIGQNSAGYGLALNENFIKMLENFAYSVAPANPLTGQIWFDSTNVVLKLWNGVAWKEIAHSVSSSVAPTNAVAGDLWFNNSNSTLNVYSGSAWLDVAATAPGTAVTGIETNNLTDTLSAVHTVGNVMINNKIAAIFSSESSVFNLSTPYSGFNSITPGLNVINNIVAQGNITATGNINGTNLSITGIATVNGANIATVGANGEFNGITTTGDILPSANLTVNLGSPTLWFNHIYGTAIHAQYADLAERFEADQPYTPGTVVELGGPAEIIASSQDLSENVFGVISTNAAYLMNSGAGNNNTHPPVAVQGRVPVRAIGKISKGDRLVSAGNGLARAGKRTEITTWNVIGRALENKLDTGEGTIEAVVKLNS